MEAVNCNKNKMASKGEEAYTAVHDFLERADGELSFQCGDILQVRQSNILEEKGFLYLYNPRTAKSGWAPSSYLTNVDPKNPPSLSFYFEVNRRKAEILLMRPDLPIGMYLLRPCGDERQQQSIAGSIESINTNTMMTPRSFALSARINDQRGLPVIKHYKIDMSNDSSTCWIYRKRTFPDINKLVQFYSEYDAPGIGRLSRPYPRQLPHVPVQRLNIPKDEIQLVDRLGNGNFGLVWKGRWKGLQVAVKMAKLKCGDGSSSSSQSSDDGTAMFFAEATSMASLNHDNLIKLIAIAAERKPFWIITELMNRGSLRDFLMSKEGRQEVTFYDMIDFMQQISRGMEYLVEKKKFCHRDLRAANVMVNRDGSNELSPYELKIGDFGLAKLLDEVAMSATYEANSKTRLPVKWTPPEAAIYRLFSSKSDIWSFGIVCYEIVTFGKMPYRGKTTQQTIEFIERGGRIAIEECQSDEPPVVQCPQDLYRIMLACWRREPEKRPSFQSLRLTFQHYMQTGTWYYDDF